LRAIVYSPTAGILPSFTETNTYFFGNDNHTIPVVSISGNTLGDGSWNGDELTQLEFFTTELSLLNRTEIAMNMATTRMHTVSVASIISQEMPLVTITNWSIQCCIQASDKNISA
jgi:hypothetical protein